MFGLSLPHLIVLALVVLVLFGKGRISEMMGDFGKGIKSFKDGMGDDAAGRPTADASRPGVMPPVQIASPVATPAHPVQPAQPGMNPPDTLNVGGQNQA